jgi:hypothetical protein
VARLGIHEVRKLAISIINEHPDGIRFSPLFKKIMELHPNSNRGTVGSTIADLEKQCPEKVVKPSRGLYVPACVTGTETRSKELTLPALTKFPEEVFYKPFADYLKTELGEATAAVEIGGAAFQKKWGTPDVVGVYKPVASDRIKFDQEIIAAEIKIDPAQPVVAFGQAVAYRLFAAKCYVVMPKTITEDDKDRLESLCMLFGIGLVLFDLEPKEPNFAIRVRAQRFLPDMFYVNEFADRLCKIDPSAFNQLFG